MYFLNEYCVLSFETTGISSSDEFTYVNIKRVRQGNVVATHETYVKPTRLIPNRTVSINGITLDIVTKNNHVSQSVALIQMSEFVRNAPIIVWSQDWAVRFLSEKNWLNENTVIGLSEFTTFFDPYNINSNKLSDYTSILNCDKIDVTNNKLELLYNDKCDVLIKLYEKLAETYLLFDSNFGDTQSNIVGVLNKSLKVNGFNLKVGSVVQVIERYVGDKFYSDVEYGNNTIKPYTIYVRVGNKLRTLTSSEMPIVKELTGKTKEQFEKSLYH